jgi:hypothetical protein
MSEDTTAATYSIKFEKDHANVKVSYDVSVPIDGPALLSQFQVTVDGADLIGNFESGQTRFTSVQFHTLAHPDQDATVSFTVTTNEGWNASDDDVLRGNKTFDDAEFSG